MIEASLFLIMKFDEILLEGANKKVAYIEICIYLRGRRVQSGYKEEFFI